jgi:hypothetical protein
MVHSDKLLELQLTVAQDDEGIRTHSEGYVRTFVYLYFMDALATNLQYL